jgi:DNA-binding GntR family transcriptional regulator
MTSPSPAERVPVRLAPLPRRTIGDEVLETLRKSIITGAFAPGDHLAEGALAEQLGVSRAPVREAMMQLEREGLLAFDKRGAARVKAFTDDDFDEIFGLRLELETMAARLACRNFSDWDEQRLAENIERTRGASRLLELTRSTRASPR